MSLNKIHTKKEKAILRDLQRSVEFVNNHKRGKVKTDEITNGLSSKQRLELKTLAMEGKRKNTQSLQDFKDTTKKWRIR